MAKSIQYASNKRTMCKIVDGELRSMGQTCKAIVNSYNNGDFETVSTFNEDGLTVNLFNPADIIARAKELQPQRFTKDGQICWIRKVYKTDTKGEAVPVPEANFISSEGSDEKGEFWKVLIPAKVWTPNQLYSLVRVLRNLSDRSKGASRKVADIPTEVLEAELAKRK